MRPKKVIKTIVNPFQEFINLEVSSGLLLLLAAVLALLWANSPWSAYYFAMKDIKIAFTVGEFTLSETVVHWVNDGLMAVFFFVVGCEMKRELLEGELSTLRKASLPFFAALGGMLVPVLVFFLILGGAEGAEGWGVPMATDIAFSLGILSLLGSRVNLGMNVFLTAFAIVDDLGAVLVIALFYSGDLYWPALLYAGGCLAVLLFFNYLGVKRLWLYGLVALVVWYFFLESGIHPTIAGVLTAFCIPSTNRIRLETFMENVQDRIRNLRERLEGTRKKRFITEEDLQNLERIRKDVDKVEPPLQRIEEKLDEIAVYFIMPVFAFVNAGVQLSGGENGFFSPLTLSIALGLVVGKAAGIFSFSWISIRLGMAALPVNTTWRQLAGLALLGGVGFTMALFIANLAFEPSGLLDNAKIGILLGSLTAGLFGYLLLRKVTS